MHLLHILLFSLLLPSTPDPGLAHRTVLLFAPGQKDSQVLRQQAMLDQDVQGLADRDILVSIVTPASDPELYRKTMRGKSGFVLLLFGRDGGKKFESETPVAAKTLFGIVDGMPMRIEEMKKQKTTAS